MLRNRKVKIVVFGEKGTKKSQLLREYLRDISPESLSFLETHCIIGVLKIQEGLLHYKIFDTKLKKVSKIISNTFFPEIHAAVCVYKQWNYGSVNGFEDIERKIAEFVDEKCVRVLAKLTKEGFEDSKDEVLWSEKFFRFEVNEEDQSTIRNLFDWVLFKLSESFRLSVDNSSIELDRGQGNYEHCC